MANLFEKNFQDDQQEKENTYPINDVQYLYINDSNASNYSNGYINFSNVSIIGSNVDKHYIWSQAYLAIPYTITVASTLNMPFQVDPSNVNALSVKSYASFIDWVSVKFNGVSCTRNSYYNHLMMNERIKTYNNDKYRLYGDIMNHAWDTGNGIQYSTTLGEYNNTPLQEGFKTSNIINQGHLQRCAKSNIDITNVANSSLASFMGTSVASLRDTENQNVLVYQGTDGLMFQGTAIIPLSELCDFFKQLPSVASSTGFELRLQSNVARENTYTVGYATTGSAPLNLTPVIPNSVTAQQIVGHTCPFLLSNPTVDGSSGLKIANAAIGNNATVTVKACIGWLAVGSTLPAITGPISGNPARIYLPSVSYNNNYIKEIIMNPTYSLKYLDFYVDSDLGKGQGTQISKLFNCQLSRVRNLYIIPFLSASSTGVFPSPFNSPLSSSPTTCTPCKLKSFNIQIGGSNI